jgi:hypothetical protein
MQASDTPVWVVGGGKTGMDTAHALITQYPGREVNLVAGSGTFFTTRDIAFPTGVRRWWRGGSMSGISTHLAHRFDGTNEAELWDWHRAEYGTWLTPETHNFYYGILSRAENETIAAGLSDVIMDHVVDAVDRNGATDLVFRSGATKTIQAGSWLVNCTGYLRYQHPRPYEPYVSDGGAVISIQPRSATFNLTSFMGYLIPHLLFLGLAKDIPLYEVDCQEMQEKMSSAARAYTVMTLEHYNFGLIADSVPSHVFRDFGLDFDRWFPSPRRAIRAVGSRRGNHREREHFRRTLDTVHTRFGIRCGPLAGLDRQEGSTACRR